jgi:nucleoside-diphosphate-sugar epimerase
MLILIAGITGMVGRPCAEVALAKGHAVRGLGRNPQHLDDAIYRRLERFEKSTGIYDIPALDRAVSGVDAIICAYGFKPEVVIEGQLLLLRAAERAGVKVMPRTPHVLLVLTCQIFN